MKKAIVIILISFMLLFSFHIMGYEHQASLVFVNDNAPSWWYNEHNVRTIQEGIANVSSGGIIYVFNGNYVFDDAGNHLEIHKPLTIIGQSTDGVILTSTPEGETGFDISSDSVNIARLTIKDARECIYMEGTMGHFNISHNKFLNSLYGVWTSFVSNISVYNNYIKDTTSTPIFLQDGRDIVIGNNTIINASQFGICLSFHDVTSISYARVFNNYIDSTENQCIFIKNTDNSDFINNTFIRGGLDPFSILNPTPDGMYIYNSNYINIQNTYINLSNRSGIFINQSSNVSVYNNIIQENQHGIMIKDSSFIYVLYCSILNNNGTGILVNSSTDNIFAYNEVYGNKYGVYID